ncbi:uncharacterized protein EAF01_003768 [Botrytis porri]|uniref:uncharacterized protein n=1 Tax=Botrytis porri TaxID=87229 RepID=UPI0018FF330B|nr:uncharacterized protein EAF01_003768 [Botrytis porri]KAF7910050.1 hypothetical protein EAF01_003768 [Botrytis porri]
MLSYIKARSKDLKFSDVIMESNDCRLLGSPLHPAVETDIEPFLDELKEGFSLHPCDFESSNGIENLSWEKAVFWIFSSSISIYANKLLLLQRGFLLNQIQITVWQHSFIAGTKTNRHLALTISTFHFGLWLLTFIITSRHESRINVQSIPKVLQQTQSWFWMMPASLTSAVALPLLMEALMHMSSLPVLIMLFPLIHLIESLTLFIFFPQSRSSNRLSLETLGIAIFTTLILYNEYRLTVPGIICSIGAFTMTGLSRALFVMASHKMNDHGDQTSSSYHGYILMTTTFGLFISGILAYYRERSTLEFYPKLGTLALFSISSIAMVAAVFSGTSTLAYNPSPFSAAKNLDAKTLFAISDVVVSGLSSIFVLLISLTFGPTSVVSWIQFTSYFLAVYCLIGYSKVYIFFENISGFIQRRLHCRLYNTASSPTLQRTYVFMLEISLTTLAIVALYALSLSQLIRLQSGPASSMDNLYTPESSSFDIVISAYKETPESIARMLKAIKSTSYLSSHNTRVLIYTKDPTVSLSMLKNSTGADIVERLSNLGREGGTYLSHIVTRWNDLAAQTMFIQAHAHNIRELIPRIDSYLVPQTGMLSLGFSESTCSCNDCGDRFGWTDDWDVVPNLYKSIYGSSCTDSTKILLSYKGQFIASARRIRGIRRNIYEDLLSTITSEIGWSHDSRFVEEDDSPDNPSFGFAVERIWGLLMQCASDDRVPTKCPSLLSGMTTRGDVGDCQCLDSQ